MKRMAVLSICLLFMIALLSGCSAESDGPKNEERISLGSSTTRTDKTLDESGSQAPFEKVEPLYKDKYITDFYVYEPCQDKNFGGDMSQYIKLVNAVIGYETKIEWNFRDRPIYLSDFYDNTFDEFNPLAALVSSITDDSETNTTEITYRFNKKDHEKAISEIDNKFVGIINDGMPANAGDFIKTLVVYKNVMTEIDYYTGELRGKARIYSYDALRTGFGVCHTYAYTCRFALAQLGIETLQATGFAKGTSDYHEWFMAKLYGNWYHFDPTYEDNGSKNFGLRYFGMTAENRAERGSYDEVYYGKLDPYRKPVPDAADDKFAVFHDVNRFKILNGSDVRCTHLEDKGYVDFLFTCKGQ